MACTANRFANNCDGCRYCCGTDSLDPDSPGVVHPSALSDQLDRIHRADRRRALPALLIRNRANN
jgi:hypothetical protein